MMNTTAQWTDDAVAALDDWFAAREPGWQAGGADPEEVRDDVRADLERRFATTAGPIGREEVRRALLAWDGAETVVPETKPEAVKRPAFLGSATVAGAPRVSRWQRVWASLTTSLWWTVLWPLGIVLAELVWGWCGDVFFRPISGWPQLLLVAAACFGAFAVWRERRKGPAAAPAGWVAAARGFGLVVSAWWALLLLPVVLVGTAANIVGTVMTMFVGLIALPVYFVCALAAGAPLLMWAGLFRGERLNWPRRAGIGGMAVGILCLLAAEGRPLVTRLGVAIDSPRLIRAAGSHETLLRMCYEDGRTVRVDSSGWVVTVFRGQIEPGRFVTREESDASRLMHYRVTGIPFNAKRMPQNFPTGALVGPARFVFDPDLGGDAVSARIDTLDMVASRLDGHVDHASGLGYCEWTMTFENTGGVAQEARMQVLLPPSGVVSRLTLWVDGEPREAAFASTARVTAAYRSVAVVRRQDPVLVRWVAPDRVLVQCFPVPAQGEMKIRFGVTAPLDPRGRLHFPGLVEQNFGLRGGLRSDVWVQGNLPLTVDGLGASSQAGEWHEVHGQLELAEQAAAFALTGGEPRLARVWTRDPFAAAGQEILLREADAVADSPGGPQTLVFVVDGSATLKRWQDDLAEAFAALEADGHTVEVVIATDDGFHDGGADLVGGRRFAGGVDNRPALLRGLEKAAAGGIPQVVWLHGPQPVRFGPVDALHQWFERALRPVRLVAVDLEGGPNQILEALGPHPAIRGGGRALAGNELPELLRTEISATGGGDRTRWTRLAAEGDLPAGAVRVWDQLARWQRWLELGEAATTTKLADAAQRAADYQLVTPWSGAVVLETQQQFDEFGLTPVDPDSAPQVPGIPEPSSALLMLLSALLLALRRQRA